MHPTLIETEAHEAHPRLIGTDGPKVTSVLNATTTGAFRPLAKGVLSAVGVHVHDATDVVHGRLYVVVELADAREELVGIVWAGYATSAGAPVSVPNIWMPHGWRARAIATQTGQGAATTVHAHCFVSTGGAAGGGSVFFEAPGSGPGEVRTVTVANPAAGSDPAVVTVPAKARWALASLRARLVTDATATDRSIQLLVGNGSVTISHARGGAPQAASRTVDWLFAPDAEHDAALVTNGTLQTVRLPHIGQLAAGATLTLTAGNLQAGDNWDAPAPVVEEWAVP